MVPPESMNQHLKADLAFIGSGIATIASWQEQFTWVLQALAALVALVAGALSLYQRLKPPAPPKSLD